MLVTRGHSGSPVTVREIGLQFGSGLQRIILETATRDIVRAPAALGAGSRRRAASAIGHGIRYTGKLPAGPPRTNDR